ncbi:MAG TPA: diacylglycerol kinase family protein [Thermoanaerobaculia bacterium]|nr:diacylglycerol kinase family protein [Thermoanaerobaculia bacterium]
MKRGILIYNPTAGQKDRRKQMSDVIDRARERGIELINAPTTGPGDATEIVRTFLKRGLDVVVASGGDGTISEVAAGLAGSAVPLAILPSGTSNVLAVELGIPLDVIAAEALLIDGVPTPIPIADVDGRPFLMWAGSGLDARIMENMNLTLKRWLGRAGIFFTAAKEFAQYEFPRLEVEIDGTTHEATFAVVSRARHYAGNWIIAPDARIGGEAFEVLIFPHRDKAKLFQMFVAMQRGRGEHLNDGLAKIVSGRDVSIRSLESYAVEVQVDGDCVLETPIRCRIREETIHVLLPHEEAVAI